MKIKNGGEIKKVRKITKWRQNQKMVKHQKIVKNKKGDKIKKLLENPKIVKIVLIFLGRPICPIHPVWGHVLVSFARCLRQQATLRIEVNQDAKQIPAKAYFRPKGIWK